MAKKQRPASKNSRTPPRRSKSAGTNSSPVAKTTVACFLRQSYTKPASNPEFTQLTQKSLGDQISPPSLPHATAGNPIPAMKSTTAVLASACLSPSLKPRRLFLHDSKPKPSRSLCGALAQHPQVHHAGAHSLHASESRLYDRRSINTIAASRLACCAVTSWCAQPHLLRGAASPLSGRGSPARRRLSNESAATVLCSKV